MNLKILKRKLKLILQVFLEINTDFQATIVGSLARWLGLFQIQSAVCIEFDTLCRPTQIVPGNNVH